MLLYLRTFLNRISCLIFIVLAATGCGPIYESRYQYIPPLDYQGIACTNNCLTNKTYCKQQCTLDKINCERLMDAKGDADYYRAYSDYQTRQKLYPYSKAPERNTFNYNYRCDSLACDRLCEENHNICYRNCGGQVIEYRECVAFCN